MRDFHDLCACLCVGAWKCSGVCMCSNTAYQLINTHRPTIIVVGLIQLSYPMLRQTKMTSNTFVQHACTSTPTHTHTHKHTHTHIVKSTESTEFIFARHSLLVIISFPFTKFDSFHLQNSNTSWFLVGMDFIAHITDKSGVHPSKEKWTHYWDNMT